MKHQYEFNCHKCSNVFTARLNHSSELGECPHCGNQDEKEISIKVSWDAGYKTTIQGVSSASDKSFRCDECHNQWSSVLRNFNRKQSCPRCGSRETHRDLSKAKFKMDVDWTHNKTDDQIADCLVPDDNGRFKNPY
jgi:DNA-directed RNA polymerase subunit RPC12/RpoP